MRPWIKTSYLALRESFIADWKPTGSIEVRLIEMMAQLYTSYEHWMALSVRVRRCGGESSSRHGR